MVGRAGSYFFRLGAREEGGRLLIITTFDTSRNRKAVPRRRRFPRVTNGSDKHDVSPDRSYWSQSILISMNHSDTY